MSEREHWERMARVAKGMQLDDPVNWPYYADEARKLVEGNERLCATMIRCAEKLEALGNEEPAVVASHLRDSVHAHADPDA